MTEMDLVLLLSGFSTGLSVGRKVPSGIFAPMVGIRPTDRTKHAALIGATGSGKSTLMEHMILQDIEAGHGVAVIDPKGDLVWSVLAKAPVARFDDFIVLDPTIRAAPLGLNIVEPVAEEHRSRAASEVVSVFKKLFADSWGPRLEYILRYCILTLLEVPGATLLNVPDLLHDEEYRTTVLPYVSNFVVREFWQREYAALSDRQRTQAIAPILNKVGPYLAYPEIRNVVGQTESSINLREIMDRRKILLVPTAQGLLGEDTSNLFGSLVVSKIQLAAMTRTGLPAHRKPNFYLYADEFQNFVTNSFEKILTEARSYGLGLVVANQYPEQLPRDLALAVAKNVAVHLTCYLENNQHRVLYRLLQDSDALDLVLRPQPPRQGGRIQLAQQIRAYSCQRYGRPRALVERAILERRARFYAHTAPTDNRPAGGVPPQPEEAFDFWQEEG
ncbi:MAG TPA: type IV secretion system DNA-binding domain-containing protein [Candidatus Tectomicrobia bacterium]